MKGRFQFWRGWTTRTMSFTVLVSTAFASGALACGQAAKPDPAALHKADAAFRAGYADLQAGKYDAARAQFAEVVKFAPQIPEGHEALGAALLALNRASEAVTELEQAARLKPNDAGIETNLALALARAGDAAKAISHFEAVVRMGAAPQNPAFYDGYARALAAIGRPQEAIEQFRAEERLTGPKAAIDDAIGTVEAQQERWDDARVSFERALAKDGSDISARVHLGAVYRRQHNVTSALATLEPAVRGAAPPADAFLEYGRALADAGQDDGAVTAFQRALGEEPNLPGAAGDLALALQRLGRQEEAIPWFQKAVAAEPKNASLLANLGLALTLMGNAKDALPVLDHALAADPKNAATLKDRGVAHIQLSAFDEAIEDFKGALALDPNDPQLHYDLGLAYKFKDRMDEAVTELKKAGEIDPRLEDPPYTLGILYMQLGRMDDAVTELRKALALRPDNGNAWAILGSTLKQAERLPEAKEALERAIALQPGQPGSMVNLAGVLAEMAARLAPEADAADAAGDTAKAQQLRGEMRQMRTQAAEYRRQGAELSQAAVNRQRAGFLLNAGNQALLKGQIAEAISRYQDSIAADGTFIEPHKQLALAYDRQGRAQDAASERAKAKELASGK